LCDHIHRACLCGCRRLSFSFFNDTVPTEIYTLSLHDALPIWFTGRLASAFSARRGLLTEQGRLLAGAGGAVEEVGRLPGVVQTVLTGAIRPNALEKLRAFGLARFLDTEIGGVGPPGFPHAALLCSGARP